jgi:hypothetical protein
MTNYPAAIDGASTLYTPADAFSTKPLETTATVAIGAGDSTISVVATFGGFATAYGVLSIDDELVIYTARNGTQFTGCQRGAFGTTAASHANGATVRANMVAGFITAIQSAVVAIETELGTAAARNYVQKNGAVTVTGVKTFQDGAAFGTGNIAGTGLMRLPNLGAVKWRKADNSGDLGMALNAANHFAMDSVIDFAAGQTFGAFSYPDATTTTKGLVQIDSVGGLVVAAGVVGLADTAVAPGTYPKTTVDQKGRVTGGAALVAGDIPAHGHAAGDIVSGALALARGGAAADLSATGPGFLKQASAGAAVTVAALLAGDLPAHMHTSAQIGDATAAATAGTVVLRDGSAGANFAYVAANNLWAFLDSHLQSVECGSFQTVGGPVENMLKYSEDFSVATWDKNGGTCTVTSNSVLAPDGNQTADTVAASGAAGLIRQNIAGLVANGQYTFYVWLKVASGTMTVSLGVLDNAWSTWLIGPTAVTLTTSWQRFKVTGTLTGGATALWVAIGHYTDGWTSGLSFYAWGACLQQGNDPKKAYARTWGYQTSPVAAGVACGALLVVAKDNAEAPFRVAGPGSNLADHTLLQVTAGGELIIAGSTGNGYRLAEVMGATNPSGWSGVLKVKTPAGVNLGYILLYSNP